MHIMYGTRNMSPPPLILNHSCWSLPVSRQSGKLQRKNRAMQASSGRYKGGEVLSDAHDVLHSK